MFNILAVIIAVAILGLFMAWPDFGLYAMIFFLPFIGWSFSIHGLVIPLADAVALFVLAAFWLRFLWQTVFPGSLPKSKLKGWPLLWPFAIFILFSLVSALYSEQAVQSFWYVMRWPVFLYLSFIFIPYNLVKDKIRLKRSLIVLLSSSALVLISGYLSLHGQDWHNNFFQIDAVSWFGIYPFGDNHNLIAEFLNAGVFIVLALKSMTLSRRKQRLLDLIFIITALAIIMTFSRAAWITLALQSVIYVGYYLKKKSGSSRNLAAALAIILILAVPLALKMGQFQEDNSGSTSSRWLLTEIAWKAMLNKPYFGYGSGQFPALVEDNIRYIAQYGSPIDAHGFLQKISAENGIFGLAAWLFIIAYLSLRAYRSIKKYQTKYPWILPLWLAGGGALFFQIFNTSYYKGKVWLPIALALAAVRIIEEKHGLEKRQEN